MRRSEALQTLELRDDATPAEIKAAYRDLVKVWHPDRFGDDARLRQRAEERLRRINEAYRGLESGDFEPEAAATAEEFGSDAPQVSKPAERDAALRAWVYLGIVLLLGALTGFAVVRHMRAARQAVKMGTAPFVATQATSEKPAKRSSAAVRRENSPVRVTHLTEAQMGQLDAACGGFAADSVRHADCVRVELRAMGAGGAELGGPDLSGLTEGERTSLQHVCAAAASYGQCASEQIAGLSAVPVRPDVSRMSARDRSAVERACSSARDHDGPAAYDQCVVEFAKMLATRGY